MMVTVTVPDERKDEFLQVLDKDVKVRQGGLPSTRHRKRMSYAIAHTSAQGSRNEEEGCLRMDLLKDEAEDGKYYFYMAYKNKAALDAHRETEHYQVWALLGSPSYPCITMYPLVSSGLECVQSNWRCLEPSCVQSFCSRLSVSLSHPVAV